MKALVGLIACVVLFEGFVIPPSNPIGSYGNGLLQSAQGVAVGADGSCYVTDIFTKRVEKFSKAGTHLLGWGGVGGGPGQFLGPAGIAIAPSGEIYVSDVNANRIQWFTPSGVYAGEFGTPGSGDGQLADPHGIAFDNAGNLYVADTFNHRIQKFSSTGTYLTKWGTNGTGDGQFSFPYGVAVDAKGDVYVADTYNHRIQKFLPDGTYLRQWGSQGAGDEQFEYPSGIGVDAGGSIFVTDTNNHRVHRYSPRGRQLSLWGSEGAGEFEFEFPMGIAAGPNGDVHVVDTNNQRVKIYRRRQGQGHQPLLAWGGLGNGNGQFTDPQGVAISNAGFVYVVDKDGDTVQKFTLFGSWITTWGGSGSGDGQFDNPSGAACDAAGNVYVVDSGNSRVQKFTSAGTYLGQWGTPGSGWGTFNNARDIAIDGSDNVYVVDEFFVQRFTTAGVFVNAWAAPISRGIGVDAEGMVYLACTPIHQVRKYAPDGTEVLRWGSLGSGIGQFQSPQDVVCDPAGYVYVVDLADRVQQFTPMGGYLEEWGQPGDALGQLANPALMAVDPAGSVYISEHSNSRIQKFASPPEITAIEDVPGDQGGSVRITFTRSSAEASPGGELYEYRVRRFDPPNATTVLTFAPGPTMVIVPSGGNTTDAFDGVEEYELIGLLAVSGGFPLMYESYGFSTDDLAPPAPEPFTAAYEAGATHLHWGASAATDLREYRLFKGLDPWVPLVAQPDTGYADVGPAGGYYRIVAVDTSDNVGPPLILGPGETVDVPTPSTLSFALADAAPNPSSAAQLTLRFTLPDAMPARLELVNVAGRCVWSRDVSGAGAHVLRPAAEFPPGIYFVRLTRGAHALVKRAVVLD